MMKQNQLFVIGLNSIWDYFFLYKYGFKLDTGMSILEIQGIQYFKCSELIKIS